MAKDAFMPSFILAALASRNVCIAAVVAAGWVKSTRQPASPPVGSRGLRVLRAGVGPHFNASFGHRNVWDRVPEPGPGPAEWIGMKWNGLDGKATESTERNVCLEWKIYVMFSVLTKCVVF